MKQKRICICLMTIVLAVSNVVPAYAESEHSTVNESETEESVESETEEESANEETETQSESEEETDTVIESDIEYKILDIQLTLDEKTATNTSYLKFVLNSTQDIWNAVIQVKVQHKGTMTEYEMTSMTESDIIFEMPYGDSEADTYVPDTLILYTAQGEIRYALNEYGDFTYDIFSTEKGERIDGIAMYALQNSKFTGKYGNDGKFVIVLDPGHDPVCSNRAWVNGVWETQLNWKIAVAMKEELEKYQGVKVYINRTFDECPEEVDSTATNRIDCLKARINRADNLQADLIVSIHNNAVGNGTLQTIARGAEVYVTRYPKYQTESKDVAEAILTELESLGLRNNGVKTRYYGDDATDTYEDGTGWDYYAINRHSTLMGMPSVLIEHAYMDNNSDLSLLRNDAKLKEIGQKDAQGIVKYYGLNLITEPNGNLEITETLENSIVINIKNVEAPYSVEKIRLCITSENDMSTYWFDAKYVNGEWSLIVANDINHLNAGKYKVTMYYAGGNNEYEYVKEQNVYILSRENLSVTITTENKDEKTGDFLVRVSNLNMPFEITKTYADVWNENNGETQAKTYVAEKQAEDWILKSKGEDHDYASGKYNIRLKVTDTDGMVHEIALKSDEIKITRPAKKITMYRLYNPNSGEHFYTATKQEKENLEKAGWNYEGIAWYAPEKGNPVYRLYNSNAGDHHYTMNLDERNMLVKAGWNYEGIGWYSDKRKQVPLYRLYNPNAVAGSHHYTMTLEEKDKLVKVGWNYEGIGWYGVKK